MATTLEEWDREIRPHLIEIRAGVDLCARHVAQLTGRPDFETFAQDDMRQLEHLLESALRRLRKARADYEDKPAE